MPAVPGALELLEADAGVSGGTRRNAAWAQNFASFGPASAAAALAAQ